MLWPLSCFYDELRLPLPEIRRAEFSEFPDPEKSLLVDEHDMTPTLEAEEVTRLVALLVAGQPEPVRLGAIHIFMTRLPPEAKECDPGLRDPFGRILQETGVTPSNRPVVYFDVMPDPLLMEALGMRERRVVHGWQGTIRNMSGEELAEVVALLPQSKNVAHRRVS